MRSFRNFFLVIVASFVLSVSTQAAETRESYTQVVTKIAAEFARALKAAEAGHSAEAQGIVSDSYFDLFEATGFEAAVGSQSPPLKSELEAQFNGIRSLLAKGADKASLVAATDHLEGQLRGSAFQIDQAQTPSQTFLSSVLIILREGFEAILIVGAIVAFLLKTGQAHQMKIVRSAVLWAVVASLATAVAFRTIINVTPAQQELMEGATMLIACFVLFTVGHWLVSQSESKHWQDYIRSNLKESLSSHSQRTLWFTCFLAVFREGAETVLFYQALWSSAHGQQSLVLSGLALGSIGLAVIYFTFKKGILKIPMKPFFRTTSSLLYALAFIFAGRSVIELQAGGYLKVSEVPGCPTISFLGIYPTVQSLILQSLLVFAVLVSVMKFAVTKRNTSPTIRRPGGVTTP